MPFILWWVLFGPLRLPIQTLLTEYLISVLNSASHLHIHASISVCLLVRPSCIPIQPVRNAHAIIQTFSLPLQTTLCASMCMRASSWRPSAHSLPFLVLPSPSRWTMSAHRCSFLRLMGVKWVCVCVKETAAGHTCTHSRATHLLRSRFDVSVYWDRTRSLSSITSQAVCCCTSSREHSQLTHHTRTRSCAHLVTRGAYSTADGDSIPTLISSFGTHASSNFLLHFPFPLIITPFALHFLAQHSCPSFPHSNPLPFLSGVGK